MIVYEIFSFLSFIADWIWCDLNEYCVRWQYNNEMIIS